MSLSPYIYLSHYHVTYLLAWSFAVVNAVWTVDVHVDVGADIAGECSVVFLTSVSSSSSYRSVRCPHAQDAVTGKLRLYDACLIIIIIIAMTMFMVLSS